MKKAVLVLFMPILIPTLLFSMDYEVGDRDPDCCGRLGDVAYHILKNTGRNDFLYLAHNNNPWYLEKKIKLREFPEDMDKYYIRLGRVIFGTDYSLCETPLQEAVKMGNLDIVQVLCKAGADIHKKIKSFKDLEPGDNASESHGCICITTWGKGQEDKDRVYEKFKKDHYIGYSALTLAQKMANNPENKADDRAAIYRLLLDHNKKDN